MSKKKQEILNTQDVLSMKGEGYYSKKTAGAKNAIDSIQEILENLELRTGEQVRNFGTI